MRLSDWSPVRSKVSICVEETFVNLHNFITIVLKLQDFRPQGLDLDFLDQRVIEPFLPQPWDDLLFGYAKSMIKLPDIPTLKIAVESGIKPDNLCLK